jgi:hypothetical protein
MHLWFRSVAEEPSGTRHHHEGYLQPFTLLVELVEHNISRPDLSFDAAPSTYRALHPLLFCTPSLQPTRVSTQNATMADNNINTRAKERARIRSVVAANEAAISNGRVPTAAIQPPIATASSTAQPSASAEPTTAVQPSPSNKSKTPSNTSIPKTSSKSAGKKFLVYNPDIDSENEECINVLPRPDPPTRTKKVFRRDTEKATRSTSGSIDVETQVPTQTYTTQPGIDNGEYVVINQRNTGHTINPTPSLGYRQQRNSGTRTNHHQTQQTHPHTPSLQEGYSP